MTPSQKEILKKKANEIVDKFKSDRKTTLIIEKSAEKLTEELLKHNYSKNSDIHVVLANLILNISILSLKASDENASLGGAIDWVEYDCELIKNISCRLIKDEVTKIRADSKKG